MYNSFINDKQKGVINTKTVDVQDIKARVEDLKYLSEHDPVNFNGVCSAIYLMRLRSNLDEPGKEEGGKESARKI